MKVELEMINGYPALSAESLKAVEMTTYHREYVEGGVE